jgi:ADP-L-glycero-D-manno-heptose 6-epimerase
MIVITGAAGFIGSSMVQHLNESGRDDLVLVADFPVMPIEPGYDVPKIASSPDVETFHETSLQTMRYIEKVPRDLFFDWLALNQQKVDFIIHLASEIDTLPDDTSCFHEYILEFSQRLWSFAAMNRIPLLFTAASTEAKWHWTGQEWIGQESGKMALCEQMKRQFDQWVLKQRVTPPLWAGFAMPEVYGPNEERMGDAASSVYQLFRQWQQESRMIIPVYGNSETSDNEPVMDRIFIKDVVTVLIWFMNHLPASDFYYLGTAYPRPFSAVAKIILSILRQEEKLEFFPLSKEKNIIPYRKIDLPLNSLRRVGYKKNFTPLEKGIRIFMREFLKK